MKPTLRRWRRKDSKCTRLRCSRQVLSKEQEPPWVALALTPAESISQQPRPWGWEWTRISVRLRITKLETSPQRIWHLRRSTIIMESHSCRTLETSPACSLPTMSPNSSWMLLSIPTPSVPTTRTCLVFPLLANPHSFQESQSVLLPLTSKLPRTRRTPRKFPIQTPRSMVGSPPSWAATTRAQP